MPNNNSSIIENLKEERHANLIKTYEYSSKIRIIKNSSLEYDNYRTGATFIPVVSSTIMGYIASSNYIAKTGSSIELFKNIPSDLMPLLVIGSSYLLTRIIVKTNDILSKRNKAYKKISNSKTEKERTSEIINYEIEVEYLKAKNDIIESIISYLNKNNYLPNSMIDLDKDYQELKELITSKIVAEHLIKNRQVKPFEYTAMLSFSLGSYLTLNGISKIQEEIMSAERLFDPAIINIITILLFKGIADYRIFNKNRIDRKLAKPYKKIKSTIEIDDEIEDKKRQIIEKSCPEYHSLSSFSTKMI